MSHYLGGLMNEINKILNDESKLLEMKENTKKVAKPYSTKDICNIMLN